MKTKHQINMIHEICIYSSLSINNLIMWISIYVTEFDNAKLISGIVSTAGLFLLGIIKVRRDIMLNSFETSGVVLEYICLIVGSSIFAYTAYYEAHCYGAISIIIAIVIEITTAFVISFYSKINKKLKKVFKRKKDKSSKNTIF